MSPLVRSLGLLVQEIRRRGAPDDAVALRALPLDLERVLRAWHVEAGETNAACQRWVRERPESVGRAAAMTKSAPGDDDADGITESDTTRVVVMRARTPDRWFGKYPGPGPN